MAKTLDATFDPSDKWMPIEEYDYEPQVITNEELERTRKFGEAVKEIIGI